MLNFTWPSLHGRIPLYFVIVFGNIFFFGLQLTLMVQLSVRFCEPYLGHLGDVQEFSTMTFPDQYFGIRKCISSTSTGNQHLPKTVVQSHQYVKFYAA